MIVTCLRCGHEDNVADESQPFEDAIFRCSECGAFMAYGELVPRMVVNTEGDRWVTVSFDDVTYKLPRVLADALSMNLQSVANPGRR